MTTPIIERRSVEITRDEQTTILDGLDCLDTPSAVRYMKLYDLKEKIESVY